MRSRPLQVGDRVGFRLNYGAMLAVMTSEYVEKAPMHDAEVAPPQKRAAIIATPQSAKGAGSAVAGGQTAGDWF